jgi:hypothetical protein
MSNSHHHINVIKKEFTAGVSPSETLSAVKVPKNQVVLSGVDVNGGGIAKLNSAVVDDNGALSTTDSTNVAVLSNINTKLGEIETNLHTLPNGTGNTAGENLSAINTNVIATNSKLATIETDIEATNTFLADIDNVLDNSLLKQTSLETKLGSIETDIEATNTKLTDIDTVLDNSLLKQTSLETKLGTIETDIEATNTKLGTIETDIEATNTKLTDIDTVLDNSLIQQTAINTNLGKITRGSATITAGGDDLQQVLLYGKNGSNNNLEPLETIGDRLITHNIQLAPSGPSTPTSLSRIAIYGQTNDSSSFGNIRIDSDGNLKIVDLKPKTATAVVSSQSVNASATHTSGEIDMRNVSHFGLAGLWTGGFDIEIEVSNTSGGTYYPYTSGSLDGASGKIVNSSTIGIPPISPVANFPFPYMKIKATNQDGANPQTITNLTMYKTQ